MTRLTDKPLAGAGLTSYRYKGRYGFIMIGATNPSEALREALRSLSDKRQAPTIDNLEVWNGLTYVGATS